MSPNNSDRVRIKTVKVVCDRCKDTVEAIRERSYLRDI